MCAAGTGILVYFIMHSRMEVLLSQQREELSAAKAELRAQKEALDNSFRMVEEAARRKAMDEFLAEIRVEERHYVREQNIQFVTRKSMIRQERVFFRNIPLSNWVEHEMPFEEGVDMEKLAQASPVFSAESFLDAAKLLR
jgi:hypothetical protein